MHLVSYIVIGIAYFSYVFCRAFQQRNVAFGHYAWVMPASFGMATIDVFVIAAIASRGFDWGFVVSMAIGGGFGAMFAMKVHKKILGRGNLMKESNGTSRHPS